jgi:hypothetical protein
MTTYACYKPIFQVFRMYVSSGSSGCCICCYGYTHMFHVYVFKRFRCLRLMLQVFYLNVAKVDLNVAYVAMAIHACFKHMF